jgi:hypothetical protein
MTPKNPTTTQQPAPVATDSPAVWPLVIADLNTIDAPDWLKRSLADDMCARDAFGRGKYGVPLQVANGRNASRDAYEEALDLAVYLRQRYEQTGLHLWLYHSRDAMLMAAAIKFQMALETEGEG